MLKYGVYRAIPQYDGFDAERGTTYELVEAHATRAWAFERRRRLMQDVFDYSEAGFEGGPDYVVMSTVGGFPLFDIGRRGVDPVDDHIPY